jgi:hypothetical protein
VRLISTCYLVSLLVSQQRLSAAALTGTATLSLLVQ